MNFGAAHNKRPWTTGHKADVLAPERMIPVEILEAIGIALLGTISGLLIGCIGIGGVILVPALVFLAGVTIQHSQERAVWISCLTCLLYGHRVGVSEA